MARNNTPNQKRMRNETTHCAYCERKLYATGPQRATIEHFYPLDMGKELNRGWNKLIVCHRCNQLKANKHPVNFIKQVDKIISGLGAQVHYLADLKDIKLNIARHHERLEGYFIMRDLI